MIDDSDFYCVRRVNLAGVISLRVRRGGVMRPDVAVRLAACLLAAAGGLEGERQQAFADECNHLAVKSASLQ
jgi:hypothetical protein